MNLARSLIDQNQPRIAVVVAHMACEVATEQRLSEAFAIEGLEYLKKSVVESLNGYSLAPALNAFMRDRPSLGEHCTINAPASALGSARLKQLWTQSFGVMVAFGF
jgi:hypothetical protein